MIHNIPRVISIICQIIYTFSVILFFIGSYIEKEVYTIPFLDWCPAIYIFECLDEFCVSTTKNTTIEAAIILLLLGDCFIYMFIRFTLLFGDDLAWHGCDSTSFDIAVCVLLIITLLMFIAFIALNVYTLIY